MKIVFTSTKTCSLASVVHPKFALIHIERRVVWLILELIALLPVQPGTLDYIHSLLTQPMWNRDYKDGCELFGSFLH